MIDIGHRSISFSQTLDRFRGIDPDQDPATFNPAEMIEDLKAEVDGIKMTIDTWEGEAAAIESRWLEPLSRRCSNLRALAKKLKDHLRDEMVKGQDGQPFRQIPGQAFQVNLQPSPWAIQISELPELATFQKYPGYVALRPTYTWNKDKIEADLKSGADLPFAQRTRGQHIRFYPKGKIVKDDE